MEIILKTDVANLGKTLDIVTVKNGYARNFLFPQKYAIPATPENKKLIEENREKMIALFEKDKSVAEQLLGKLKDCSVSISRKVIEDEKLYGSVTVGDIAESLKVQGFKIEKRQIELEEPIKQLGVYSVNIKLFAGVETKIKVWVVQEEA